MPEFIFDIDASNFSEHVIEKSRQHLVLVDFWAEWCGPCKILMPLLDKLAREYNGQFILAKVDSDRNQALAMQYGVRSIPNIKAFKGGKLVDEFMGVLPEERIRAFIDRHLDKESDRLMQEAGEYIEQGDYRQAIALLEKANAMEPESVKILRELFAAYHRQGQYEKIQELFRVLPIDKQGTPELAPTKALLFFLSLQEETGKTAGSTDGSDEKQKLLDQVIQKVLQEAYQDALDLNLQLVGRDGQYGDGQAVEAVRNLFLLLEKDPETVKSGRRKLAMLLN